MNIYSKINNVGLEYTFWNASLTLKIHYEMYQC